MFEKQHHANQKQRNHISFEETWIAPHGSVVPKPGGQLGSMQCVVLHNFGCKEVHDAVGRMGVGSIVILEQLHIPQKVLWERGTICVWHSCWWLILTWFYLKTHQLTYGSDSGCIPILHKSLIPRWKLCQLFGIDGAQPLRRRSARFGIWTFLLLEASLLLSLLQQRAEHHDWQWASACLWVWSTMIAIIIDCIEFFFKIQFHFQCSEPLPEHWKMMTFALWCNFIFGFQ